jgi:hypothetical protein
VFEYGFQSFATKLPPQENLLEPTQWTRVSPGKRPARREYIPVFLMARL